MKRELSIISPSAQPYKMRTSLLRIAAGVIAGLGCRGIIKRTHDQDV